MSEWISVKERLPKHKEFVLGYLEVNEAIADDELKGCVVLYYEDLPFPSWSIYSFGYRQYCIEVRRDLVKYWMPLQDAPKFFKKGLGSEKKKATYSRK